METVAEHILEAAVAVSPPRRIGLPRRTSGLLILAVGVLCLFLVGGCRTLGEAAALAWAAAHHTGSSSHHGNILTLILPGGAALWVTLWLLAKLTHWYRSRLHLLQWGIATVGTILHKRTESANSQRYYLRYGYAHVNERGEHEEEVNVDEWKRFEVGKSVTVLYDAAHPELAGLYVLIAGKPG